MERPITALSWQIGVSERLGQPFPPALRRLGPYVFALACIAAAAAVRGLFALGIGADASPYLVFVAAVLAAALIGGVRPGLFAAVVSLFVADILFVSPVGSLHIDQQSLVGGFLFFVEGVAVALVAGRLRTSLLEVMANSRRQQALAEISRAAIFAPDERWLLRTATSVLGESLQAPVEAWIREEGGYTALRPEHATPASVDLGDATSKPVQVDGRPALCLSEIPGEAGPRGILAMSSLAQRSSSAER